ncbi:hypothetical protein DNTS_001669 [Danionella cerebrum]|uniref:Uncharacterized protein n=1 Tax=Danionella cerebrum TaxID=2873325 RepID=A0A553QJ41_9TELE|nr:hypothetical protein DNTS_001669 [Danionella translucida]
MAAVIAEDNLYDEDAINVAPPGDGVDMVQLPEPDGNIQGQVEEFLGPHPDYDEEEEERKYYRRKRLAVVKNVLGASCGGMIIYSVYMGLLQMQLILHYDETYREVKYGTLGLEDIDNKMLMGINFARRFLGTKWMMFLASGIYALFVSTNYWERYYTLVPSAVAIGVVIVPLWASLGNYITRMAHQYYEYVNYKDENVQEQKKLPKGAFHSYIIIFQSVFYMIFHLSFIFAEFPMVLFLNNYLNDYKHTLYKNFNKTVLKSLPRSLLLIEVESVLMGAAFLAMLIFLVLCGAAYRPTEEIDLRSIGWGNIFQLPFKHLRDYRIRLLCPFFIYSGFEVLFAVQGLILSYGVCAVGMEKLWLLVMVYGLSSSICSVLSLSLLHLPRPIILLAGAFVHFVLIIALMCWSPGPREPSWLPSLLVISALWGLGTALNKTGVSTLLGMLYEDKERLDFVYTIYHWWQAIAIFIVYLWSALPMRAKLGLLLFALLVASFCYVQMERRLAKKIPYRLPRIPRPRHKVKGYRYLEEENSDESDTDLSDAEVDEKEEEDDERRLVEEDKNADGDPQGSPQRNRVRDRRKRHDNEQVGDGEDYVQK